MELLESRVGEKPWLLLPSAAACSRLNGHFRNTNNFRNKVTKLPRGFEALRLPGGALLWCGPGPGLISLSFPPVAAGEELPASRPLRRLIRPQRAPIIPEENGGGGGVGGEREAGAASEPVY